MRNKNKFWLGLFLGLLFFVMIVNGYHDCKTEGCLPDEICMANGECTDPHQTVEGYCENHGFSYEADLLKVACQEEVSLEKKMLCEQCQGDYKYNKNMDDIRKIIYSVAAGIAILLLVVNSYHLLTSQDLEERENAKKGIIYVILGLVLLIGAEALVETIFLKVPSGISPTTTSTVSEEPLDTTTLSSCMLIENCRECLDRGCEWCQELEVGEPLCLNDCDIVWCNNCVKVKAKCGVSPPSPTTTTIIQITCSQECQKREYDGGGCREYVEEPPKGCQEGEVDITQEYCPSILETCCCYTITTTTI